MKTLRVLILVLVAVQAPASAQEVPRTPVAPNGAVTVAGEADRELQSSIEELEATGRGLEKGVERALSAEFLGVQESERMRLFGAHLDVMVENIEIVLADKDKLERAFQRLVSAAKDAPPKLRAAEAHFRRLADAEKYPNVKDVYLAAADWYHARGERIESGSNLAPPSDADAEIDHLRSVARSLRELQAAVKGDPQFLEKIDPSFQRRLYVVFSRYDQLPKTLRAWSENLTKGVVTELKSPDRPPTAPAVPPTATAPASTPAKAGPVDLSLDRILLVAVTAVGGLITRWLRR
jgi:hypothetical protein